MSKILLKNGRIWDGEKFYHSDILICDNKIERISENICEKAEFIYDAKGKTVSAGLVDAHMHMKGISSDMYGISADTATLPFGVTAAADGSACMGDETLLNCFNVKACVFVCSSIKNNDAYFENAEKMMMGYNNKVVGIKAYYDSQAFEVYDIQPLIKIVEFARKNKLTVMIHCSNSPVEIVEIVNVLGKGDILTHAFQGTTKNAAYDNFKALAEARNKGVYIDAGMAGHVHTDIKIFGDAIKQGFCPDIISTDITRCSAYIRGGRYGMTMCMSIAKKLGMREEDIFKAVTSTPAKALGKENEWGYLNAGRTADISVFDFVDEGFDLTDNAGTRLNNNTGYRCILTVADGQIIYKH